MRQIAKSIAATLTALGTWGYTASADGVISMQEWFGLCGVAVAGVSVWYVTNEDA